jgi:hypothetical protein
VLPRRDFHLGRSSLGPSNSRSTADVVARTSQRPQALTEPGLNTFPLSALPHHLEVASKTTGRSVSSSARSEQIAWPTPLVRDDGNTTACNMTYALVHAVTLQACQHRVNASPSLWVSMSPPRRLFDG